MTKRNRIEAIIDSVESGKLSAVVWMHAGAHALRAVVTMASVDMLSLRQGLSVWAEFNSHEVLLMQSPLPPMSAGNVFAGVVTAVRISDVMAMVELDAGGLQLRSWVTRQAVELLELDMGSSIVAVVKSTEVSLERKP